MRSFRAAFPFVLLLGSALAAPTPADAGADRAAEAAFRTAREYTVRIRTRIERPFLGDEQGAFEGAGFLVDAKRGWIVTNAHVVGQSPADVKVAFAGESYQSARRLYVDAFADVAVLSLDAPVKRVAAPILGGVVQVGEPVGAYGHPLGVPFTGTRGIVSCLTDQAGPDLIQIDATVDHGNSGGPVIALSDGRVVGIATYAAGGARDRLNFATPIADVRAILDVLRRGGSPCPPRMPFALLQDEDDRFTFNIACTFDSTRWPFVPGDRIVAVEGVGAPATYGAFVNALRGRSGLVNLTVERAGRPVQVVTRPMWRDAVVERRGISIDGALIAPVSFEDEVGLVSQCRLAVHSVESSSTAQSLGIQRLDVLFTLDGRRFDTLDELIAWLQARPKGPMRVEFRRYTEDVHRVFEYHGRELPGEEIELIGPGGPQALANR
jgi:S1-C subfamily serine protease